MKKLFLLALACVGFVATSNAQEISENAIGLRLGDSKGFGAEVTYQRAVFETNRIELDLGIKDGKNYNGFKLAGIYQWVWNIDGGFNWYAGPGAGFGAYKHDVPGHKDYKDSFVFLSGNVGIEYKFDFPLLLSFDVRPEFGLGDERYDNDDLDFDVGISARYTF
ncbi:hypothetical protein DFR65_102473 [Oceanihabitans sediminis]|uniref:Porin family protein n=1 Tax=Oceanihabitans sediminis TaxID=1812012 RepID=A0A368P4J0_9FLAO|nr:hypothetical protein [Oceanihabitans sediminis]RBP33136.1 hypothetical protein DFR65_102473 [Oceanihabitans sediminis]RCU57356.1 hypothetical protein DU428_06060 [Oceanihabitans sediminis]